MNGKEQNMIDELKYDYVELSMPNMLIQWAKDKPPMQFQIESFLSPFITTLARRYPNWRFVGKRYWEQQPKDADPYASIYSFNVYQGREKLGELSFGYGRNHERVFRIKNERIENSRKRGDSVETKDMTKAVKTVGKLFGGITLAERLDKAMSEAADIIESVQTDRERRYRQYFYDLAQALEGYFVENFETLMPVAKARGLDDKTANTYLAAYNEHIITKEIRTCYAQENGIVVLTHGSDYVVKHRGADGQRRMEVFSSDTLPEAIKRKLGMLKLTEPKHFLRGVGMRVDETAFFILPEGSNA